MLCHYNGPDCYHPTYSEVAFVETLRKYQTLEIPNRRKQPQNPKCKKEANGMKKNPKTKQKNKLKIQIQYERKRREKENG